MMDPKYLRDDFASILAHTSEETGELMVEVGSLTAAIGKTARWGPDSYNPEIPVYERELNADWIIRKIPDVRREMVDLDAAMTRLEEKLAELGYYVPAVEQATEKQSLQEAMNGQSVYTQQETLKDSGEA